MRSKPNAPRGKFLSLDFTGVDAGGNIAVEPGTYLAEVLEVTEEESSEGNDYLKFKYRLVDVGATVYDNKSLLRQSLWALRGLLDVLGIETVGGPMKLDLRELIGRRVMATIELEEYGGKQRPRIVGFGACSNKEPEPDEDTPPTRPARRAKPGPTREVGDKVRFKDENDKIIIGTITDVDGDTLTVETKDGDEWSISESDVLA
ncbi:MAG: hypothetical protein NHG36_02180 [Chromatiaceae bacterium]|nr:hypothetical protein [Candidatus Thioaporhodococcus sediminis]